MCYAHPAYMCVVFACVSYVCTKYAWLQVSVHIGCHHAHDVYIMDGLACAVLLYICMCMQALCVVSAPKCGCMCGPPPLPLSLLSLCPGFSGPGPQIRHDPPRLTGERYWCL